MDVLQPHAAKMSLGSAAPLELSARVCHVCFEQRTNLRFSYCSSPTVACVAESTTIAPKSASLVTVRLPRAVQDASTVVIEPLNTTVVILGCAAVCSLLFSCRCLPRRSVKQFRLADRDARWFSSRFCQHSTSRLKIVSSHCYCPSPYTRVKTPNSA